MLAVSTRSEIVRSRIVKSRTVTSRTGRSRRLRTFALVLVAAATGAGGLAASAPLAWASPALAATAAPRAHVAAARAHAAATRGHATATPSRTLRVSSLNDSGHGTLRWALRTAGNAARGISTVIDFTVAGQITLLSALPPVAADVWINGESAPGYAPGGPPVIGIDFGGHQGLTFTSAARGGKLLGVAIENAGGNGVTVDARSVTLNANYIGLGLTGAKAGNHGNGVVLSARSSGDRIGLNPSGMPGVVGNVISDNWGSGIVLAGSSHDTIAANRIGTNPAGTGAMGNRGNGIVVTAGGRGNELGGTEYTDPATGAQNNPTGSKGTVPPVFVVPPLGNLISANGGNGVLISRGATGNVLNGNFIGTTASGNGKLGNGGNGVWIDGAGDNSLTGCKFVNNPFVYYNVVSNNGQNGLRITSSADVVVQGNFFGVGANNTTLAGNRLNGILVDGSSANTQVGGVIPLGNVSAGNGTNGIEVSRPHARLRHVQHLRRPAGLQGSRPERQRRPARHLDRRGQPSAHERFLRQPAQWHRAFRKRQRGHG